MSSRRPKVVMTDTGIQAVEYDILEAAGAEVIETSCRTPEEVLAATAGADAILNVAAPVNRDVIRQLDKCLVISRYGVGVDTVDIPAATEAGILVANVPDFCWDEVADTAISLAMCVTRKIRLVDRAIRAGQWGAMLAKPLRKYRGSTLGILGFGNIGKAVAERALALKFDVIAYDPYVDPASVADRPVELVRFDELIERADVLTIHTPLTDETRHIIGEPELRRMKDTAVLINTSRGSVVDQPALCRALSEGWIAGAGLDVFEQEPPDPGDPILKLDNVVLTPHYASYTVEAYKELSVKAAENVVAVLRGKLPPYIVNPAVIEGWIRLKVKA